MTGRYILDDQGEPVPCEDLLTWSRWLEQSEGRQVSRDYLGAVMVSTVFLGLDHGWGGGAPVLWETMIFGGTHDGYQDRYTTRADALHGHAEAVALVRAGGWPRWCWAYVMLWRKRVRRTLAQWGRDFWGV